ncbi:NOB1 family endonuclease [Methanofollis fontis]|uniref:Endoribonuclease Nob1 n=1 Tax=Methanofollis fontis TaxID=2052832 RepID=A0A483CTQ0_9EURY|nr:nucleotide-binding protein [Methanofollis fontis]TAJ45774.1 nucleotide-binding protein [Methanofollis fontis]
MKAVLDATAFFVERPLKGDLFTTPEVVSELVDLRAKCRFEALLATGLIVSEPSPEALSEARVAADESGDIGVLSETDLSVIALAHEIGAVIYTDDFALQNAALRLGIRIEPIQQRRARKVRWKFRCTGCGRYLDHDGECPVCGAAVRRTRR